MKRLLPSLWTVVVTALVTSTFAPAHAESADERLLVVAVNKSRGSDARLVKGLGEHLQRSGIMLAEGTLSTQDRACESSECIEALGKRERAQLVLTAKLQDNAANSFYITMALFDTVKRAPFQATAVCDECNQDALLGKLSDVADKLLRQCHEARQSPVRSGQVHKVPLVPLVSDHPGAGNNGMTSQPKVEQGFFSRLSPTRKIVAGVLGGLAGAALITSIALTATDKHYTTLSCSAPAGQGCKLDNLPLYATGYALTGALAVSIGISLGWPQNAPKTQFSPEVH